MLIPYSISPDNGADEPQPAARPRPRRKRRGVTSLEYCVMASCIIAVLVLAVQHIGSLVSPFFGQASSGTQSQSGTTGS
jgi:Flp pilus assembly pilin Flp